MPSAIPTDTPSPAPGRFLALGDSYTIGESVAATERWPVQLMRRLQAEGYALDEPRIIARTGWTTGELLAAIAREAPQGPYDLVSLLIGVNNQFRGGSRAEFAELVDQAVSLAGGDPQRVVVLSIPDYGATPFGRSDSERIGREIIAFNAVNFGESARLGTGYVDVTPISRQAADDGALIARDGLHPSAKMYAAWADLALPIARALFDQPAG